MLVYSDEKEKIDCSLVPVWRKKVNSLWIPQILHKMLYFFQNSEERSAKKKRGATGESYGEEGTERNPAKLGEEGFVLAEHH